MAPSTLPQNNEYRKGKVKKSKGLIGLATNGFAKKSYTSAFQEGAMHNRRAGVGEGKKKLIF